MSSLPGIGAGLPATYGANSNSATNSGGGGSANLVPELEAVFTIIAGAIASQGGGGATLASEASNPIVQSIAQTLDTAIHQISGQGVNLLDFLQGGGGVANTQQQGTDTQDTGTQGTGTQGTGTGTQGTGTQGTGTGTQGTGTQGTGTQNTGTQNTGTQSTGTQLSGTTSSSLSSLTVGSLSSVTSVAGSSDVSESQFFTMISTALAQNGNSADNDLSGPDNIKYWDPNTADGKKNLDSFYAGVVNAHNQFFQNIPMTQFAQAVVAEAGAESTLNPTAGGGGLLQVNPADAVADYNSHGSAIKDANGNTILSPGQAWDPNNPETNVLMWAWYNKNNLAEGGVAPNNWGKGQSNGVANTYGNILADWLGGPGDKLGDGTSYYTSRIQRFYEKIGGTDFQGLLNQPLSNQTVGVS